MAIRALAPTASESASPPPQAPPASTGMPISRRSARSRTGLVGDCRGSVFVEFILVLPVMILLWTLLNFTWVAKRTAVVTQRQARECAWSYALSGCKNRREATGNGNSSCEISGSGAMGLAPSFTARTKTNVQRPAILGGYTTATGRFRTACGGGPPVKLNILETFEVICRMYGFWCPL